MQRVGSGFGGGLKGSSWKTVIDSGVKQVKIFSQTFWPVKNTNHFIFFPSLHYYIVTSRKICYNGHAINLFTND